MITRGIPDLHPDSSKWYWLQWSQKELGAGAVILTATWTVPGAMVSDATDQQGLTTGIRLSADPAAVPGSDHQVVCRVTTTNDEILHAVLQIRISAQGH